MKLKSVGGWAAATTLLLFSIAIAVRAADQPLVPVAAGAPVTINPAVCLKAPLYDDGIDCLYEADYYDDGPNPCETEPQSVIYWAPSGKDIPQFCSVGVGCDVGFAKVKNASGAAPRLTPACPRLKHPLPINHRFLDGLPPSVKAPVVKGIANQEWDAQSVTEVLLTQWVRVQAHNCAIPVKLYVVRIDLGKAKLAAERLPKTSLSSVRIVQVGFEMKDFPADVDGDDAPLLYPTRWVGNPKCVTACTVKPDPNEDLGPFFVMTHHPVFEHRSSGVISPEADPSAQPSPRKAGAKGKEKPTESP